MRFRNAALGLLSVGAIAAGGAAMASPAWAASPGREQACHLSASKPTSAGNTLSGVGGRSGCSDTVTYFWVRVYEEIDFLPDAERAVKGSKYLQNGELKATGSCNGRETYYTHTSTATGLSGDDHESGRAELC
jgi:hypothetical protein